VSSVVKEIIIMNFNIPSSVDPIISRNMILAKCWKTMNNLKLVKEIS